jgi:hypothetical protein
MQVVFPAMLAVLAVLAVVAVVAVVLAGRKCRVQATVSGGYL